MGAATEGRDAPCQCRDTQAPGGGALAAPEAGAARTQARTHTHTPEFAVMLKFVSPDHKMYSRYLSPTVVG